eukprot:6211985-Pleurochrysis_carterae.AAC.3
MISKFYIQIWLGAPYSTGSPLSWKQESGTASNIAADRMHSIGPRGISYISSISAYRCKCLSMTRLGELIQDICIVIVSTQHQQKRKANC